jgi:hypothetical protein
MKGLVLEVHDCRCTCGNKWTNSRVIAMDSDGGYGGTPSPRDEAHLPLAYIFSTPRDHSLCFRCGPIGYRPKLQVPETPPLPPPTPEPDFDPLAVIDELRMEKL